MFTLEDFAQLVFSYTLQKQKFHAAAERALKKNLQSYMRPDLFGQGSDQVNIENLLLSAVKRFERGEDDELKRVFLEDTVNDFISKEKGDELRSLIEMKLERVHHLPEELSEKIISSAKTLNKEELDQFKKVRKDIISLMAEYIKTFFDNLFKEFIRSKKKEQEMKKEISPDMEVLPDSELISEAEKKQEWQQGLTKDLFAFINKEISQEKRYAYKMILLKRFMAEPSKRMNFVEMSDKTGFPKSNLERYEKDLGRKLAEYLSAGGLGPKFVQEGGLYKEDVKVPSSKDILSKPGNLKDFKEFIREKGESKKGENFLKIMDLLAEGKNNKEIEQEGFDKFEIGNIRTRQFNKWYEEWYQEMVEDIREACERILKAYKYLNAEVLPSPSHEKAVKDAIGKKYPLELTVTFSANYDLQDTIKESDRVDPKKDPVDFKYLDYRVTLDRTKKPVIHYKYEQKLTDKGEFEGSPRSSLTIENNPGNETLKGMLDEYVEKEMKPEGILPYGPSVTSRKPVRIPVEYVNNSLDSKKTYDGVSKRTYRGFIDFADKYRGFMVEDQPHLERVEEESKREIKKLIPKGGKSKVKKLVLILKEDLSDEKGEKSPNQQRIKDLTDRIKELEEHLKKDDEQQLVDFVSKHEKRFKFAVSEERLKRVKELQNLQELVENQKQRLLSRKMKGIPGDKDTLKLQEDMKKNQDRIKELTKILEETKEPFPAPESEKVNKWIKELSDYGITDKKLYEFLTPADLTFYVNQLQTALAKEAEENKAGVTKNKNMDEKEKEEEYKKIDLRRSKKLNDFIELFEAVPADLKKRLGVFKTSDPNGFKRLESKHGKLLNWIESPGDALSKLKKKLLVPKLIEVPKGKRPAVVPMEEEVAKGILNFLENQLGGFDVIGKRFGDASLISKEFEASSRKQVEDELKKAQGELEDLQSKLSEAEKRENPAEVEELRKHIPGIVSSISKLKTGLYDKKEIPALIMTRVLGDRVSDFSKLYMPLTKTLWFTPKTFAKRADIAASEEDTLGVLQKNIAKDSVSLSKQSIFDSESIKALLKSIQTGLSKFKKDFTKMASSIYTILPYTTPKERKAAEEELIKKRIEYIFPGASLADSKEILKKLKEKELTRAHKSAVKELRELVLRIEDAYNDFDKKKINDLAKKENISYAQAGVRLKKIKDAMAAHALNQFILRWKEVLDRELSAPLKEKGPLGGKPSEKYEKILEIIEEDVPELFELTPPEEEMKEPPMGIPTPKDIRERIEKEFEGKPKDTFDFFVDSSGAGGSGGGSGGGRPKPVKKHPPSYTFETLKSNFKNDLQTKNIHKLVLEPVGSYLLNIKHHIKGGDYFDVDDIVAGVVDILKNFKRVIKSLKVSTAPGGSIDIRLKDDADAVSLFNKLSDIYKLIDMIANPVKIGPLPGDLSKIKSTRGPDTWFPSGLMDVYQSHTKGDIEKDIRKKTSAQFLAFRLAHKFSSLDLQTIESLKNTLQK